MEKQNEVTKPEQQKKSSPEVRSTTQTAAEEVYPEKIPESQGDLADRANIEIEQEIEEKIFRVRQRLKETAKN